MEKRRYENYRAYVQHQKGKADQIVEEYGNIGKPTMRVMQFKMFFSAVIETENLKPGKVLCLAARFGEEVLAWRKLGFDPIGIDLNPVFTDPDVIWADFHYLPFKGGVFDYIWSNSMDHALYPEKMINEAHRVLKVGGKAIFEVRPHKKFSIESPKKWEALFWESQEELIVWLANNWPSSGNLPKYHDFEFGGFRRERDIYLHRPMLVITK